MPGNVQTAAALTVMPTSLCAAFTEYREYRVREGGYPDGPGERSAEVTISRKRFKQSKWLSSFHWKVLRDYYLARRGGTEAFYFYFGNETVPPFSSDPTGQDSTGRYIVRFENDFSFELGVGRNPANITLIEVA